MLQATGKGGKFRKNTMEEKKAMRNSRRRRLRKDKQSAKQQCKQLKKAVEETKIQLKVKKSDLPL